MEGVVQVAVALDVLEKVPEYEAVRIVRLGCVVHTDDLVARVGVSLCGATRPAKPIQ